MPATAATLVHRPTRMPRPMAVSPMAMTRPTAGAIGMRWEVRAWIGLRWVDPTSWAWIEMGLEFLRKLGLASFWRPAYRKVTPRNRRSGMRTQPVTREPSGRWIAHMSAGAGSVVPGAEEPARAVGAFGPGDGVGLIGAHSPPGRYRQFSSTNGQHSVRWAVPGVGRRRSTGRRGRLVARDRVCLPWAHGAGIGGT